MLTAFSVPDTIPTEFSLSVIGADAISSERAIPAATSSDEVTVANSFSDSDKPFDTFSVSGFSPFSELSPSAFSPPFLDSSSIPPICCETSFINSLLSFVSIVESFASIVAVVCSSCAIAVPSNPKTPAPSATGPAASSAPDIASHLAATEQKYSPIATIDGFQMLAIIAAPVAIRFVAIVPL